MTVVYACRVKARESSVSSPHLRKLHSLYARALLAYAVKSEWGLDVSVYEEGRSEAGKPCLLGAPFHFNLSHSRNYAVCALSDMPVGVDIEHIRRIDPRVQRRLLGQTFSTPFEQVAAWTRYESYGKMVGCGIPYPTGSEISCYYRLYTSLADYLVSVCSPIDSFGETIRFCEIDLT